jgi:arsenite methyltransferase
MKALKPDYGIDAPGVVRNLTLCGAVLLLAGLVPCAVTFAARSRISVILAVVGFASAFCFLITAGLMMWSSKSGKLRQRERLIDSLGLAGHEKVLDVGCGRGLLLNGVARRLPDGKAFGIDLWQNIDQSGNSPEATLANARAEDVDERVEIRTADMRELPFPEGSMDDAISSLAIHNVPDKEGRAKAVREIARVLKRGGKLALQDFRDTDEYVDSLRELGWKDVRVSRPSFYVFPPVRIVSGTKP